MSERAYEKIRDVLNDQTALSNWKPEYIGLLAGALEKAVERHYRMPYGHNLDDDKPWKRLYKLFESYKTRVWLAGDRAFDGEIAQILRDFERDYAKVSSKATAAPGSLITWKHLVRPFGIVAEGFVSDHSEIDFKIEAYENGYFIAWNRVWAVTNPSGPPAKSLENAKKIAENWLKNHLKRQKRAKNDLESPGIKAKTFPETPVTVPSTTDVVFGVVRNGVTDESELMPVRASNDLVKASADAGTITIDSPPLLRFVMTPMDLLPNSDIAELANDIDVWHQAAPEGSPYRIHLFRYKENAQWGLSIRGRDGELIEYRHGDKIREMIAIANSWWEHNHDRNPESL